jgi:hypothetical protein
MVSLEMSDRSEVGISQAGVFIVFIPSIAIPPKGGTYF